VYLIRLDDASEYMDVSNWLLIEAILDKYEIKPIVGIIPKNEDKEFVSIYSWNPLFWDLARNWQNKGWTIALHGYEHVYCTSDGGLNPINMRSEFAGVPLEKQREKIQNGIRILKNNGLEPKVFFAPSHTFDVNTLEALRLESDIRVICDTIANDVYALEEFYFIPQQSGRVRRLPFRVTTFCYHPNNMNQEDFQLLDRFLEKYRRKFGSLDDIHFKERKLNFYDKFLRNLYFSVRKIRLVLLPK